MAMSQGFKDDTLDLGVALITHIGLVDDGGTELTGGSPAYARIAVTWVASSSGVARPNADLTFNVPSGETVGGWRGYTASSGGTDYEGASVDNEVYTNQGEYKLLAASTAVTLADL